MTDDVHEGKRSIGEGGPLWGARFSRPASPRMMAMSRSLDFDRQLWRSDLRASREHVRMLGRQGILPTEDVTVIESALDVVEVEMSEGRFVFVESDEDIHTAIERRVTQIAGPAGGRLHTARSRNDQVVTALRLWCREQINEIVSGVFALVDALSSQADLADGLSPPSRVPGYTHLQRAQPVLLSHHLLAHVTALYRDADRLLDARARADVCTLGAGALAGSSLPIDPESTARNLGFRESFINSLDAVSDRDFVAEMLFALALLGTHLSRIGEEWVLWSTSEFGFLSLDDSVATGSSMLPQKKNADIAELARGKTGRLIGNLTGLLTTLKGLPLAYNRDLQEDKEPLFDSVSQVKLLLAALAEMVSLTTFDSERMARSADDEALIATDLAEWLVSRGVPFREAHAMVGTMVRDSAVTGETLRSLSAQHPRMGREADHLFEAGAALARRTSPGGAGTPASARQRQRLAAVRHGLEARMVTESGVSGGTSS